MLILIIITLQKCLFSHTLLCDSSLFIVVKKWRQFRQQKSPFFFDVIPLDNADNLFFTIWVMFWNISRIYIFFFSIQNIKAIVSLSFSIFFQSSFLDGKFISSHLYLFIKCLIFVILWGSFFISSWFNATVTLYWKHLSSFLLMGFIVVYLFFIQPGESTYDTPRFGFTLWHL